MPDVLRGIYEMDGDERKRRSAFGEYPGIEDDYDLERVS